MKNKYFFKEDFPIVSDKEEKESDKKKKQEDNSRYNEKFIY